MNINQTFTLKQQTPILHFQHDQSGATLRATEVKPKLDRFLIKKLGEQAVKGWLIGNGEHPALNYKIRFINGKYLPDIPLGTKTKVDRDGRTKYFTEPEMYPQVLANMGGKDSPQELKHFRMYETVRVEIFSFHEDLIAAITKVVPAFFATHNFGNRQSKGFGGFYLDAEDSNYQDPAMVLRSEYQQELVYWAIEETLPVDDLFADIDILYRLIKSGFNFPDHPVKEIGGGKKAPDFDRKQEFATYQPSFLKNYFLRHHQIGSEKRAVKESLFRPDVRIAKDPVLKGNNYIRAILGTAEFFEYRDKDRRGMVKIESDTVERFQSAVTFKVFGDKVFLLPGDWSAIKNKTFVFSTDRDRTKAIPTPTVNFDLAQFLTEFAVYFNNLEEEVARLDEVITDLGRRRNTPELIKKYLNCLENVNLEILPIQPAL